MARVTRISEPMIAGRQRLYPRGGRAELPGAGWVAGVERRLDRRESEVYIHQYMVIKIITM